MIKFFKKLKDDLDKTDEVVDKVEITQEKIKEEKNEKAGEEGQKSSQPNIINYDGFSKIEMKVGEIIEAEKVENADRLLKLKVRFGNEERQIVSGISEYFKPEELIGVKCPFVTNLEPRQIRGIESRGMILAAKDKTGNFSLLKVGTEILSGTKLS